MAFMNARDQAHLRTYGQRDYRQWYNATTARIGWAWGNVLFYGKGEFAVSTVPQSSIQGVLVQALVLTPRIKGIIASSFSEGRVKGISQKEVT
jgi:hypothetical protein